MKKVLVLTMMGLFFGCVKKVEKVKETKSYVISEENKEKIHNNDTIPPPPPIQGSLVYGTKTFVINSDSTAYYFQNNNTDWVCGTVKGDTIPYFVNLQPKNLIEISNKNICDFIKLNYKDDFRNITFISSKSDTLKSKFFFDLYKSLKFLKKDRDIFIVRRTTQEEDTVTMYKKNNKYYNSDNIKWDKSRIKFPQLSEE